jgi:hypothetical protein
MKKIILIMLLVTMFLSLGSLSCERQEAGSLNMQIPDQVRTSETVVITITDNVGNPMGDVRIYSPEYLGDTGNDGKLVTFFKEPGEYYLSARTGKADEPGFIDAKDIGMINIIAGSVELESFDGLLPLMPPGQTFTGEYSYKPGMTVRFRLKNISDKDILLDKSAPWKMQSRTGEEVFQPIALQVITQIEPGEAKEWTWNQKDNNDLQAGEGGYVIILRCSEGEYRLHFWIVDERMTA